MVPRMIWVTGGKGTRDRMDGGPEPAASAGGGDCGDPEQSLASTGVSVSQTSRVELSSASQAEPGRGPTRGGQSLRGPQRWDGNGALGLTHLHKG